MMSVIDKIIENVNALSPATQQQLLELSERLRSQEARAEDAELERWSAEASKNAFADLPANEWDDVYKDWTARHPEQR
jgi:hypothetical protein